MKNNEMLIERIRSILLKRKGLFSEKKMFGSVCFMLNGNICVGTWKKGSLLVRCDKKKHDEILTEPHTMPANMSGRIVKGWVLIDPEGIEYEEELTEWINRAIKFTSSLPSKHSLSEPLGE